MGDLAKIEHGWPFQSELFSHELSGRPIVVGIGNFNYSGGFRFDSTALKEYRGEYPASFDLHPGDILLVMTCQTAGGEILGIPARVPDDGRHYLHNQRLGKLVVTNPLIVCPEYLYWLFLTPEFNRHLVDTATGTKILHTAPSRIESFEFMLPPVPEQRRIASTLGALDDKIELNRRMSRTLESMARALFKSWFVDFDPVRAKAEGREPGVSSDIACVFPDALEDSEVGEIPKGWRAAPIGELAIVAGGSTPSTGEATYWENGRHCWATPKDLSALTTPVLLATERMITDSGLAQIGSGLLPAGTVLLSSRAPIGYLAIAEVPVAINQGFIAMKPLDGVSNLFLRQWAESAHDEILSQANGSTFLEISKSSFRPIPVLVPPEPVMEAFDRTARPLYRRVVSNDREIHALTAQRDRLLPNLVSGILRTHHAKPLLEVTS